MTVLLVMASVAVFVVLGLIFLVVDQLKSRGFFLRSSADFGVTSVLAPEIAPPEASTVGWRVPQERSEKGERAGAIEFKNQSDETVLAIDVPDRKWLSKYSWTTLSVSPETQGWLNRALISAPQVLSAGLLESLSGNRVFRVKIPHGGKLMHAADGGFRGMVIDKHHRIIGHVSMQRLPSIASPTVLWELASAVTAQKFLADISRKLTSVESGIHQIQSWLQHERTGQLQSDFKFLLDLAENPSELSSPESRIVFMQRLEQIEEHCSTFIRASISDL